jgi:hypothetical protein
MTLHETSEYLTSVTKQTFTADANDSKISVKIDLRDISASLDSYGIKIHSILRPAKFYKVKFKVVSTP